MHFCVKLPSVICSDKKGTHSGYFQEQPKKYKIKFTCFSAYLEILVYFTILRLYICGCRVVVMKLCTSIIQFATLYWLFFRSGNSEPKYIVTKPVDNCFT